jgi:hypothetical protein
MGRMTYFPLLYKSEGRQRFLIWVGGEKDSIVVDADGSIPTFDDAFSLRQYAELRQYNLETEEPVLHDLDWVQSWCADENARINCSEALNAWNLFADIAASVQGAGHDFCVADHSASPTYQKLFWGSNLPSVTPEGESYVPEWSVIELENLRTVLSLGIDLFRKCTVPWTDNRPGRPGVVGLLS